jgi:hypothetical protein
MLGVPEELPATIKTPAQAREWVKEDYIRRGYEVASEPGEANLPEELQGFHMDFLAEKDQEFVAVVVRRRDDLSENTKALAAALENRPDWILDLVVLPASSALSQSRKRAA